MFNTIYRKNTIYIRKQSEEKLYRESGQNKKEKRSVFNAYIYRKTPIRNIVTRYIRKKGDILLYIEKYCFTYIREILVKALFPIYKKNIHYNLGKIQKKRNV